MTRSEKMLVEEIKKTLAVIAQKDPQWRFMLGSESLSVEQLIAKLGNHKKLKETVLKHYIGLAVELEQQARHKLEAKP